MRLYTVTVTVGPTRNVTHRFEPFEKLIITLCARAVSHISFSLFSPPPYFFVFSSFDSQLEILAQLVITNRANRCSYLFIFFPPSFSLCRRTLKLEYEAKNALVRPWDTTVCALHYVLTLIPRPSSARQCERLQSVYAIVQRYLYAMFWRSLKDTRLI